MAKNRVGAIALGSINSATFTGNYQALYTGIPEACFLIRIVNASNRDITISYDGTTDHDYLQDGDTLQLPLQANNQPRGHISLLGEGTHIYVKGTAGTGYIYFAGYYAMKD